MNRVAVAATGEAARDAALEVAQDGGTAVDAAVAAALVAMSTEPGVVSMMGGAFVNVWPAGDDPWVVDGNVEMPGRGLPTSRFGQGVRHVRTDYGGGVTMGAGHGSVATSGAVQALALARDRAGVLPWRRLVEPAARACRDGYRVGAAAALYLGIVRDALFGADPEAHALVTGADGGALQPGETSLNTDLADILDLLAAQGPSLFTTGAVGRVMVEDMAAHDGLVTAADLAAYEAVVRTPTLRPLGGWTVALNPPPSVGGPMLAAMLGELSARSTGVWSWADVVDVQRRVLAYRLSVHDRSHDLLADGTALLEAVERHGLAGLPTSASTAHVSVVDDEGTACAITMSSGYGAGMVVPGTGILLNNALGEPELNRLGLHAVAPGTRLASNMAPTTARSAAGGALAVGSPGADRITTALMQVLGRSLLAGEDLQPAIDAPRAHVRFLDDADADAAEGEGEGGEAGGTGPLLGRARVDHEPDPAIAQAARALGLEAHGYPGPHMYFGGVGAAQLSDLGLVAAGDGRREAAVGISPA
ncbi:gamma-glutamyltransferase [Terracoccus luteus]|uniref:Gamma-glutamyltranspeptidase/glutathione hydrolase n=1 Tax=Terracoccus luteus TaxID=53356 RepID=A0A839Q1U3_9MICO|nr:gamma-glutamyltransferase [Terracoccus luteus]MBB2987052.1 gamma-glutamyltranspeptidase/glutathione hydrolase [Terracoccus luteus]MCP2172703.1 gamma-glutamyltranspeptidase/glutathione hydrolase [Terracoccus luteus]